MAQKKRIILISFAIICYFLYFTHSNLYISYSKEENKRKIILPNERFLNIFTPDFAKPFLSDIFWIKLTPKINLNNKNNKETGEKLYQYMMLITDLDPYFYLPYILGGSFLPGKYGFNLFKEGITLLDKGIKYLPKKWQLSFLAGYYYFFEKNKKDIGYKYFQKCMQLETTPKQIKVLIPLATLKFKSKKERLKKLEMLYNQLKDKKLKNFIKKIIYLIKFHKVKPTN